MSWLCNVADILYNTQWQPSQNTAPSDGFSFTRSGTAPTDIQIALYPNQQPRRFKVAPELGNLLDLREDSKLGILNAMWSYIQRERLLENSSNAPEADRRNIKLDDQLSRVRQTMMRFEEEMLTTCSNSSSAVRRSLHSSRSARTSIDTCPVLTQSFLTTRSSEYLLI